MSFKKASLVAMLAVTMTATPVLAQTANPASSLSVAAAADRAGAEMEDANAVRGGWLIPAIAIVAIILGVLALSGGNGDRPTSP